MSVNTDEDGSSRTLSDSRGRDTECTGKLRRFQSRLRSLINLCYYIVSSDSIAHNKVHTHAGFHLEIVPRGGETIVFITRGARKRLDLNSNITATSIKGGDNKSRAPPLPLNETLIHVRTVYEILIVAREIVPKAVCSRCGESK